MLSKSLTKVCVCVLLHYGDGFTYKGSNILLGHQTKSTVAECVKRLCLGCVDEILAAFLEFPGVDREA